MSTLNASSNTAPLASPENTTRHITPRRHPDGPRAVPMLIALFARSLGIRRPSPRQFAALGANLMVGDAPADQLVDWMSTHGVGNTRPLFETALANGIDSIPDAPQPLREFFEIVENTPSWVDHHKLAIAGQVMRSGGADGLSLARDVELLGGYMFAGFNQTLLRTGALEKGSNQRFAETSQWALDVITDGGLTAGGTGYRSTVRVRLIHALVRRHVSALPDWDSNEYGLPINQTDMAATLIGALVAPTISGIGLGIISTPAEYDAVAHLGRYVGWLMGVHDELLPKSFRDSVRILYHTSTALSTPDETTPMLALPMIEDPLQWHYKRFPTLRRRIARSQHLGITRAFLGRSGLRNLGITERAIPWYPVVRVPINLAQSVAATTLPGGRRRAADHGETRLRALMRTMTDIAPDIGSAAHHITE